MVGRLRGEVVEVAGREGRERVRAPPDGVRALRVEAAEGPVVGDEQQKAEEDVREEEERDGRVVARPDARQPLAGAALELEEELDRVDGRDGERVARAEQQARGHLRRRRVRRLHGRLHDDGEALGAPDLYVLGFALLAVEVVAVTRLVRRFSGPGAPESPESPESPEPSTSPKPPVEALPGWGTIGGYAALGTVAAVIGGHAVGDFAGILVEALLHHGFSEMVGAIFLSIFAAAGALVMVVTAHRKGMYALALANASGQVTQVPFVVLPIALILLAQLELGGSFRTCSYARMPQLLRPLKQI